MEAAYAISGLAIICSTALSTDKLVSSMVCFGTCRYFTNYHCVPKLFTSADGCTPATSADLNNSGAYKGTWCMDTWLSLSSPNCQGPAHSRLLPSTCLAARVHCCRALLNSCQTSNRAHRHRHTDISTQTSTHRHQHTDINTQTSAHSSRQAAMHTCRIPWGWQGHPGSEQQGCHGC